jgi:hypothetical protein
MNTIPPINNFSFTILDLLIFTTKANYFKYVTFIT